MIESGTDVERQQIFAITEAEKNAVESGDLAKYLSLLSDDAVFLPQNALAKSGKELRQWLGEFLERVSIKYTGFAHGETIIRDDLACHFYTCSWTAVPRSGGPQASMFFKGMHVLRRQPDRCWRISRNIWNTDPSPSPSS